MVNGAIQIRASKNFVKLIEDMQKQVRDNLDLEISATKATDIFVNALQGRKIIIKKESKKRWGIK